MTNRSAAQAPEAEAPPVRAAEVEVLQRRMIPVMKAKAEWISNAVGEQFVSKEITKLAEVEKMRCGELLQKELTEGTNQTSLFFPYTPVVIGRRLESSVVLDSLESFTDKQIEKLKDALSERQERMHEEFIGQIVNTLDEELFLTRKQRDEITASLSESPTRISHALYAHDQFALQNGAVASKGILSIPEGMLSQNQQTHFASLTEEQPTWQFAIVLPEDLTVDEWGEPLFETFTENSIVLQRYMKLRRDFLLSSPDTTADYQRRMDLACHGVLQHIMQKRVADEWKRMARYYYERGDHDWQAIYPATYEVQENGLWKYLTASWDDEPVMLQRKETIKNCRIAYVEALLDQELWLKPSQNEPMRRLITDKMKTFELMPEQFYSQSLFIDLQLLGSLVHSVSEDEVSSILSPVQLESWKSLKDQFHRIGDQIFVESRHDQIGIATMRAKQN